MYLISAFQHIIRLSIIYTSFFTSVFKIQCVFYAENMSQFGLATFHVLQSHIVAYPAILDSAGVEVWNLLGAVGSAGFMCS